jgi:hypothetical protein
LGYGKTRGSPMAVGDGGPSWVEVDTSERLEEGLKSELERSASSTLVRQSSSMVQLGRGTVGRG